MPIQQLPLHTRHVKNGAKLGLFGDWEVPLYYKGILEEHAAVRTAAGLFDISHMGKFYFEGSGAVSFFETLLPRKISTMTDGKALYMPLLNEQGGFIDDIILYRAAAERFYMIVNASNVDKDWKWIVSKAPQGLTLRNETSEKGLLAVQGPKSAELLERILPGNGFSDLKYYRFKEWTNGIVARTGYTGEDGFEIMADIKTLENLWDSALEAGKNQGVMPVGFGARDTLRLEAGMPLYGHDMNDEITPFEAGLDWAVDMNKETFVGKPALLQAESRGIGRKLVGFEMIDRGIPRQDYEVFYGEAKTGQVTSGTYSPTLKKNIGLAYVQTQHAVPGGQIEIQVRDKKLKACIVKLPFYKRA